MPPKLTAKQMFHWGITLTIIAVVSSFVLDDLLVMFDYYLSTSDRYSLIFTIVDSVVRVNLLMGVGLIVGSMILRALQEGSDS